MQDTKPQMIDNGPSQVCCWKTSRRMAWWRLLKNGGVGKIGSEERWCAVMSAVMVWMISGFVSIFLSLVWRAARDVWCVAWFC